MEVFFNKHSNLLLGIFALSLFLFLIVYAFWGVEGFTMTVNNALAPSHAANAIPPFDLQAAQGLDLRGLMNQSSSSNQSSTQ